MRVNGVGGSGDSSMGRDSSASMDASSSALLLMNIGLDRTALRSMAFWTGDLMSEPGESVSYTGLDSTDSMSVVGGGVFVSSCVEGFEGRALSSGEPLVGEPMAGVDGESIASCSFGAWGLAMVLSLMHSGEMNGLRNAGLMPTTSGGVPPLDLFVLPMTVIGDLIFHRAGGLSSGLPVG